jgi:aminoglycoside N3'-acetyltransferase
MKACTGRSGPLAITKNRIKADLKKIGIRKGDHVAVALSFKSLGYVIGGPDTFIDALLDVVGPAGTIMMNVHTLSFPLSEIDTSYIFDPETTVPFTGLVPITLMQRKTSIRSRHPTCSVAAIGKLAKYLTDGHNERSEPYLPFEKLAQIGGKCLFIGTNDRLVAIRHASQKRAGLFVVPKLMGVLYKNARGEIRTFKWFFPPCTRKLPELVPKLIKMGAISRGKVGLASSIIGPVDKLIEAMTTMLNQDPTLNLCDDIFCVECRELERRMKLSAKFKNYAFVKKNKVIQLVIGARNKLVLQRYRYVAFRDPERKSRANLSMFLEVDLPRFAEWIYSKKQIVWKRNSN